MWRPDRRTQSVLFGQVYLQLFSVQDGPCRLVTQHQVWSNLRDGKCAARVLRVHQQEICKQTEQMFRNIFMAGTFWTFWLVYVLWSKWARRSSSRILLHCWPSSKL